MRNLLFLVAVLMGFFLSGCCSTTRYNTDNVGVGMSAVLDENGELDLKKNLDVSKLPAMVEEAYKEGLAQKKKGEELQRFVVQSLSEKIRSISTVDLDADGNSDPILVIPEGDDEQMTLSVRVPNPDEVKELPKLSDAAAWQDIGENKSVELVALTAVPKAQGQNVSAVEIEARPNNGFYTDSHYYRHSFTSDLLTYMLVRDLFFRPVWFGPSYYGWYGGYYRPMSVRTIYTTRSTVVNRYSSAGTTYSRVKTSSGRLPGRAKSSELASQKSFSAARGVRQTAKTGGFGRTTATSSGASTKAFGRRPSSGFSGATRTSGSSSSSKSSSARGWFSGSLSSGGSRGGK